MFSKEGNIEKDEIPITIQLLSEEVEDEEKNISVKQNRINFLNKKRIIRDSVDDEFNLELETKKIAHPSKKSSTKILIDNNNNKKNDKFIDNNCIQASDKTPEINKRSLRSANKNANNPKDDAELIKNSSKGKSQLSLANSSKDSHVLQKYSNKNEKGTESDSQSNHSKGNKSLSYVNKNNSSSTQMLNLNNISIRSQSRTNARKPQTRISGTKIIEDIDIPQSHTESLKTTFRSEDSKNLNSKVKKINLIDSDSIEDEIFINKKEEFLKKEKFESFKKNYTAFVTSNDYKALFDKQLRDKIFLKDEKVIQELFDLFTIVTNGGGYFHYLAYNLFKSSFELNAKYKRNIKEYYDDYLFHYELFQDYDSGKMKESNFKYDLTKLKKFDPKNLLECPLIIAEKDDDLDKINEKIQEGLKYDLVILRGFIEKLGLNEKLFTLEYFEKNRDKFKNHEINVVEQKLDFYGFMMNKHTRQNWKLLDYIEYVRSKSKYFQADKQTTKGDSSKEEHKGLKITVEKHKEMNKIGKNTINPSLVYYGVNIPVEQYQELYKDLENNINPLINFGSEHDMLSYVREHIPGMTMPQMYIKVPSVWTGGHEENLRMRSVNINHGPGNSIWYASTLDETDKFYEVVKQNYKLDIYKKEGVFFPHFDFFLLNNVKVIYCIQQANDVVLVGPGSIHWVRAEEHSINTSWNFGTKDVIQLKSSMKRYEINKTINFRSLIPMQTLIFDLLNFEMFTLDIKFFLECQKILTKVIDESIKEFNQSQQIVKEKNLPIKILKELNDYNVSICEKCYNEVFLAWGFCDGCSGGNTNLINCLSCFFGHSQTCNKKNCFYIFYKYEISDLEYFKKRMNERSSFKLDFINEFIAPQTALLKQTKDKTAISKEKIFKVTVNTQNFLNCYNTHLYNEYDADLISKNLFQYCEQKFEINKEVINPLDPSDKENALQELVDYEMLIQDNYKNRFSPIYEPKTMENDNFDNLNIVSESNPYKDNRTPSNNFYDNTNTNNRNYNNLNNFNNNYTNCQNNNNYKSYSNSNENSSGNNNPNNRCKIQYNRYGFDEVEYSFDDHNNNTSFRNTKYDNKSLFLNSKTLDKKKENKYGFNF